MIPKQLYLTNIKHLNKIKYYGEILITLELESEASLCIQLGYIWATSDFSFKD